MIYNNYPLPLPNEAVPIMIGIVFLFLFFPNGLHELAPIIFSQGLFSLGAILVGIILVVYFGKHLVSSMGTFVMFFGVMMGIIFLFGHG